MYAMTATATLDAHRRDEALEVASDVVIPAFRSQPGHVASYFLLDADGVSARSISFFETKDQAVRSAANVDLPSKAPFRIHAVEVSEVISSA
jgi:hypothetical protein